MWGAVVGVGWRGESIAGRGGWGEVICNSLNNKSKFSKISKQIDYRPCGFYFTEYMLNIYKYSMSFGGGGVLYLFFGEGFSEEETIQCKQLSGAAVWLHARVSFLVYCSISSSN